LVTTERDVGLPEHMEMLKALKLADLDITFWVKVRIQNRLSILWNAQQTIKIKRPIVRTFIYTSF